MKPLIATKPKSMCLMAHRSIATLVLQIFLAIVYATNRTEICCIITRKCTVPGKVIECFLNLQFIQTNKYQGNATLY